jgi:serine/threonine-protein phosphatase 2A regulatory subunit A
VFEKLSKDEQDSVRILAINNCIALGKLKGSPEWQAKILQVIKASAEDKSWRVRYKVADHVQQLCEVFQSKAAAHVIPLYLKLLGDQEVEVRTIAAARISEVAKFNPTKEFLETLLPCMEKLTQPREQSMHVRVSLAGSILGITPIFGPKLTVDYLVNIVFALIRDESAEVRLKLISTLGELSTVVGSDVLSQSLLPSIRDLGKDRQWRVRLAVIDCMPSLANYLGEDQFTQELTSLYTQWMVDPVFSVRSAAASSVRELSRSLGTDWCVANMVPVIHPLLVHKNYLYRISVMMCARALAEVVKDVSFLEKHLVPMAVKLSSDTVPNVRFNAGKALKALHKPCQSSAPALCEKTVLPSLRQLSSDQDPDVKFHAVQALRELGCEG